MNQPQPENPIQYLPFTGEVITDNNQDSSGNLLRITIQLNKTHDQDGQSSRPGCLVDNLLYRVVIIHRPTGDIVENYVGPWGMV